MQSDDSFRRDIDKLGNRLVTVRDRLRPPSLTHEQPPSVLEEALAEKVWNALGHRADRVDRFVAALQARVRKGP